MENYNKGQTHINSIIGEGTLFRGDLDLSGLLRIDGDFEGHIKTDGRVLIGRGGRAHCILEADTVVIGGLLKGDIKATSKVILLSTSIVLGNICTSRIVVEDGVIFHGHCIVSEDENVLTTGFPGESGQFSVDWNTAPVAK